MPQKKRKKAKKIVLLILILSLFIIQLVLVSAQEEFDEILKPVQAIYDLVKYAVTVIAGLVLLFAGISYITGGSDPIKRDRAKNMVTYVLIGLIIIWAAPFLVRLILGD